MLRADYNHIIDEYLAIEQDIMEIDSEYEPAMEADAGTTNTTTSATPGASPTSAATNTATGTDANGNKVTEINARAATQNTTKDNEQSSAEKTTRFQNAVTAVKKFLKRIADIIAAVKRWLSNRLNAMVANDRSFQREYLRQKQLVKPHDTVTVINYGYENAKLEKPMENIMRDMQKCLNTLSFTNGPVNTDQRVSDIINAEQGKMIETLFKPYTTNAKDPVTTAPAFVKYIVGEYRSEKQERTYRAVDIPVIEKNAMSTNEIKNRCSAYINECTRLYERVRNLERELKPSDEEANIRKVKENARKAAVLYNTYNSLVHMYFECRVECSVSYRIILKKFYGIL